MVHYGYAIKLTNGLGVETSFQILADNITGHFEKQVNLRIRGTDEVEQFRLDLDWAGLDPGIDNPTATEDLYNFCKAALQERPVHIRIEYYGFGDIIDTATGEVLMSDFTEEEVFQPENLLKVLAKDRILGAVTYDVTPIGTGISDACIIDLIPEGAE